MEHSTNSNNVKVLSGVVAIVALISGILALVRPMGQRIEALERNFSNFTTSAGTPATVSSLAQLQEKFVEVETQFSNLDERTMRIEAQMRRGDESLEERLQI